MDKNERINNEQEMPAETKKNHSADADRVKEVYKVTIAGSIINVVLLVLKFAAGILGHSAAMIADAIHSLTDFATDVVVLVFVKLGNKPMDKDHDYGHGKYETLATAIIVLIKKDDQVLLVHARNFKGNFDSLVAGFVETGENLEEAVHREVMEEVGLKVKNLRYYKSQPWSFSSTLLFGFFCDVDGDDTLTVDHEELSMAQWVERDKIPDQGNNISLTKEMMMLFRDGKEPR